MQASSNLKNNADVWKQLYAEGKNDLRYPNDVFVRCCYRYFGSGSVRNILDYGFGTGANLIHLAQLGYNLSGIEISEHALQKTRVPGQEGCILAIPDEIGIAECFPGRTIELGEFSYRLGEIVTRHWVVVFRKN